jgi:hypothetical protein
VTENVSRGAGLTDVIAEQISGVSNIADLLQVEGNKIGKQVSRLLGISRELEGIVSKFKL